MHGARMLAGRYPVGRDMIEANFLPFLSTSYFPTSLLSDWIFVGICIFGVFYIIIYYNACLDDSDFQAGLDRTWRRPKWLMTNGAHASRSKLPLLLAEHSREGVE